MDGRDAFRRRPWVGFSSANFSLLGDAENSRPSTKSCENLQGPQTLFHSGYFRPRFISGHKI